MAIMMAIYIFRKPAFEEFLPENWRAKLSRALAIRVFSLGLPGGFQFLFEVGAFSCAAIMMGWVGAYELAAHQIAINLASITFMFAVGISIATSIREGYAIGRGDWKTARRIGISSIAIGGTGMALFGILFISLRNILPLMYVSDPHVVFISAQLLIIAGIFQFFDGVQGVCVGALRGILDLKIPTLITFVAYWILCIPLAYFFGIKMKMGAVGIWSGLLSGLVFSAIFLSWRYHRKTLGAIRNAEVTV
jgi:MATE family multidrug resistance protein